MLIYGASGAVGSMATQIAAAKGMEVTAVTGKQNRSLLLSLGSAYFLDYTAPDFHLPPASFDLVFDAVGKLPKKCVPASLRPNGQYATVGGSVVAKETAEQMRRLAEWYKEGKIKPIIHQRFAFEDIKKAHALVDTGHKRGSVVLIINNEESPCL